MPIRVVCKHCGKQFSAWDDLIGKAVKCPKCQKEMVVHSGNDALDKPTTAGPPPTTRPAPAQPNRPAAAPPPATPRPVLSRPVTPPMPAVPSKPASPYGGTSAYAADDLDDSEELPYACPHCNRSMPADEDLCDHCGYHRVLKRRIDISEGVHKPDKTVGFERLFKGQLADANSAESTLLMMKVVGGIVAAGVLFICVGWWSVIPVAIAAAYFVYWRKSRTATAGDADPSAVNRDVASTFIWTLTLSFQRTVGWRAPAWPFPTTKALTLHDSTFTDQDLSDVEDLSSYVTLDLEGTQISNAGLEQLHKMKQLRNIVLRRTNVTVAGVQRLQQALPKASIWY